MSQKPGVIALFDVDGTLTVPRNKVDATMTEFMKNLRQKVRLLLLVPFQ